VGIPTIVDRCVQAMVKNALEPFWEARFEGTSYGFRPGRGCQDAIKKIFGLALPQTTRPWVLDADIEGAFEFIPIKSSVAKGSNAPGNCAAHSRFPSPNPESPSSTGEVGL
jgi:RNA-directed DNA polymerase